MTMRSLALFTHVLGMLGLFVALALEWAAVALLQSKNRAPAASFSVDLLRRLPRFTGAAVALIVISGIYMGIRFGLLQTAWVGVALAAMALMNGLSQAALRPLKRSIKSGVIEAETLARQASNTFLRVSLHARVAAALAIVALMLAKPDLLQSVAMVTIALVTGAATARVTGGSVTTRRQSQDQSVTARMTGEL